MSKHAENDISEKKVLITSDLHLVPDEVDQNQLFMKFCQNEASEVDQVFILGDLFNLWLGDDLSIPKYRNVIDSLQSLSTNTDVFIMPGNRDFLLGKQFEIDSGCKLLTEPYLLKLNRNNSYVLIHGDTLCTDDTEYQRFKALLQHPITKFIFLNLSKKMRLRLSGQLRKKSIEAQKYKSPEIMDVNNNTVDEFMAKYPNANLIHGHTHRQRAHKTESYKRYVLGDWYAGKGNAIRLGTELEFIEIN